MVRMSSFSAVPPAWVIGPLTPRNTTGLYAWGTPFFARNNSFSISSGSCRAHPEEDVQAPHRHDGFPIPRVRGEASGDHGEGPGDKLFGKAHPRALNGRPGLLEDLPRAFVVHLDPHTGKEAETRPWMAAQSAGVSFWNRTPLCATRISLIGLP
jgi:hypothetical protein